VIAIEGGTLPRVRYVEDGAFISAAFHVKADELVALPMAYFHGEVPR
jgi:hypothetical protein